MTYEEFKEDFEDYINETFETEKLKSPYKTGNLRNKAYKIIKSNNGYKIYIDMNIAPYAKHLDSTEKIKREYPNGWFNEPMLDLINKIKQRYGGE